MAAAAITAIILLAGLMAYHLPTVPPAAEGGHDDRDCDRAPLVEVDAPDRVARG